MINRWIKRQRKMMAWGLGMALAFSTIFPSSVANAYDGYDSTQGYSWTNEGITADEQNRFETYGYARMNYTGTRPDGTTGNVKHTFALMVDPNKKWVDNVARNEGGHEKRYTSSVDEVYDFSNEFGAKATIMVLNNNEYVTIPDSVRDRSLKAGTTVCVPIMSTARFKGADIRAEAGVKFEAMEYSDPDAGTLCGTFDFRSSTSHVIGSGLIMVGRSEYFLQKDYTVTQSGDYAVDVTINKGQALKDASFTGTAVKWSAGVDGAWSFVTGDTVPDVGTHTFDVVYSPTWNVDYQEKTFTGKGRVTVVDTGSGSGSGSGAGSGTSGSGSGSESGTGGSGSGSSGSGSGSGAGSGTGGSGSESGSGTGGSGSGSSGSGSGTGTGTGTGGSGTGSGTGSGAGAGSGTGTGGNGGGTSPSATQAPGATASPLPSATPLASETPLPTGSPDAATGPAASLVKEPEVEPPVIIEKIVSDISDISSADKPAKVKMTYVSRVGTTFTVKVSKVTKKKPTGYQIQYTTKKSSWKGAKSKKFKKVKMTIKGLRAGKRYYFRVRAYRKVKGQIVYGKWSKRKKI